VGPGARIKVPRWELVADVVTERIAKVRGLERTETLMAFRVLSKEDMKATYEGFE
jgi:hypothetical protein